MNYLYQIILLSEEDPFSDLKAIGEKIIPSDPWSFVIQLVATALLVLLIAKLFYKPAMEFINARKKYVEEQLSSAENQNKEAQENLNNSRITLQEAKTKAEEIINSAKQEASNEANDILASMKKEVADMKANALKEIENDRNRMVMEVRQELVSLATLAAGKIISTKLDIKENENIISDFLREDNNG